MMNAALLSLALLTSSIFEFLGLHVWHDIRKFLCGLWLVSSPLLFGYAGQGQLRYWHLASGAFLLSLALFNFKNARKLRKRA